MWLATGLYIPDAGLHPANQEPIDEPIFDEPQVIASDQGALAALRLPSITRVELLLGLSCLRLWSARAPPMMASLDVNHRRSWHGARPTTSN
jgi:hypothetical protein